VIICIVSSCFQGIPSHFRPIFESRQSFVAVCRKIIWSSVLNLITNKDFIVPSLIMHHLIPNFMIYLRLKYSFEVILPLHIDILAIIIRFLCLFLLKHSILVWIFRLIPPMCLPISSSTLLLVTALSMMAISSLPFWRLLLCFP
jgi:hypothetical protein